MFDRIVYFGDSLTDTGTIFDLSGQVLTTAVPPSSAGYAGQFSNGDVYADVAPALLGVAVDNFAAGGARAVGSLTLEDFFTNNSVSALLVDDPDPDVLDFDINLGAQIGRFLAANAGGVAPDTAASILIGLNDYNNFTPTSTETALAEATTLISNVVQSTLGAAVALAGAGVGTVVIQTLPLATFAPGSQFRDPATNALADQVIAAHNAALLDGAAQVEALGVNIEIVDLGAMAFVIAEDPSGFGFTTPLTNFRLFGTGGDPVIVDDGNGPEPVFLPNPAAAGVPDAQLVFWDLLHPTAATHGILGAFQAASLTQDVAFLGETADLERPGRGDDVVFARGGDDKVIGGRGDDASFGGLGQDYLIGGHGDDILSGQSGDDLLKGGTGADVLGGGAGDDRLLGGLGNDVMIDGLGSDLANGGLGDDIFLYAEASLIGGETGVDRDVFVGGLGDDTLYLALTEETRALVEAELSGGRIENLGSIGVVAIGIENFVFVDIDELGAVASDARLAEADLWGLV